MDVGGMKKTITLSNESTCYYCNNDSEYWDMHEYEIISVCRIHFAKTLESSS